MTNASLPVVDPLEERRRKKRARTAAWRKHSRKLKQAAAGTQNFDNDLFELVPYTLVKISDFCYNSYTVDQRISYLCCTGIFYTFDQRLNLKNLDMLICPPD
jgi:hypothetical protein